MHFSNSCAEGSSTGVMIEKSVVTGSFPFGVSKAADTPWKQRDDSPDTPCNRIFHTISAVYVVLNVEYCRVEIVSHLLELPAQATILNEYANAPLAHT